jgi:hypothetical protein
MKTLKSASITATFVSAILSMILPASAIAADDALRPREPAPVQEPANERLRAEPFRNDPIVESKWGPGDSNLAVPTFHFARPESPKDARATRAERPWR